MLYSPALSADLNALQSRMSQRRRSFTFARAHQLGTVAALVVPPLVAYAPDSCRLVACLVTSLLLGAVGLAYERAFAEERQAIARQGLHVLRQSEPSPQPPASNTD